MALFTILGLEWWKWFLFVDLPLSIIFIILVIVKFPKIKAWARLRKSFKSYLKYEYDEDFEEDFEEDFDDEYDDEYEYNDYDNDHNEGWDENHNWNAELTPNEKRKATMMEKYGVPYPFMLKDKQKTKVRAGLNESKD